MSKSDINLSRSKNLPNSFIFSLLNSSLAVYIFNVVKRLVFNPIEYCISGNVSISDKRFVNLRLEIVAIPVLTNGSFINLASKQIF